MVIDYIPLKELLQELGGFIPNIYHLLQRVGQKKNKFYALMDLMSGYHQFPLDPAMYVMTVFVTFMGVFEWLQVPMGVKPAANYFFHTTIMNIVLVELVFFICEVFLDDMLVYGSNAEEYVMNLRLYLRNFLDIRL